MQEVVAEDKYGRLLVEELPDGRRRVSGQSQSVGMAIPKSPIVTEYPIDLILEIHKNVGSIWTCDEISRDIDPNECALDIKYSVEAYFPDSVFLESTRILDYGCGSGASTIHLARMFPRASIVGVDMVDTLLAVARRRASHHGLASVSFATVTADGCMPEGTGRFDLVFLNAVFEHLLPSERMSVLREVWRVLSPGGSLILNQTPHRWFPIETHTSGLPLVNFLPDSLAHVAVSRLSGRGFRESGWDELLRAGVRGASVGSVTRKLGSIDPRAQILPTVRVAPTWAGIWYAAKRARMGERTSGLGSIVFSLTERLVNGLRLPLSPYVNIAFRKPVVGGEEDSREWVPSARQQPGVTKTH